MQVETLLVAAGARNVEDDRARCESGRAGDIVARGGIDTMAFVGEVATRGSACRRVGVG